MFKFEGHARKSGMISDTTMPADGYQQSTLRLGQWHHHQEYSRAWKLYFTLTLVSIF